MLRAYCEIGHIAICPKFLGILQYAQFDWAYCNMPKIIGHIAICPEKWTGHIAICPTNLLGILRNRMNTLPSVKQSKLMQSYEFSFVKI